MTVREYILEKFEPFGSIREAQLFDIQTTSGLDLDAEYCPDMAENLASGVVGFIGELILSPKLSEEGDGGSRAIYDYSGLGRYYLWLCKRWGMTADEDVKEAMGLSRITDRSDSW